MQTPPHTPTKPRLSASELEASAHLLSPSAGRRSGGGANTRGSIRLSATVNAAASTPVKNSPGPKNAWAGATPPSGSLAETPDRNGASFAGRDRFIPERDGYNADVSRYLLINAKENTGSPRTPLDASKRRTPINEPYAMALTSSMLDGSPSDARHSNSLANISDSGSPMRASGSDAVRPSSVLNFHAHQRPELTESERYESSNAVVYEDNRRRNFMSRSFRVIPQTPERILDAPDLIDDFYLNLLDWSQQNILAVALSNALYLWNAESGDIKQLMSGEPARNVITGLSWSRDGSQLAVGLHDASCGVWDPEVGAEVTKFKDHTGRIGAISWNGNVLATGSRDSAIRLYDVRAKSCIGLYQGHSQEVCGLRWSPSGTQLASGGNDNLLNVWDFNRQTRECTPSLAITQHNAAVKAIAWNPVQSGVLASGGGTADKTLKIWNVHAGELINSVDTRSQVCGAVWNPEGTEIVTSHGYSDNQLSIWKVPSLTKVTDLTGHSSRVLHLASSPDGQMVVSAAGDETIRFWRCFADPSRACRYSWARNAPPPSRGGGGAASRAPPSARLRSETDFDYPELDDEALR